MRARAATAWIPFLLASLTMCGDSGESPGPANSGSGSGGGSSSGTSGSSGSGSGGSPRGDASIGGVDGSSEGDGAGGSDAPATDMDAMDTDATRPPPGDDGASPPPPSDGGAPTGDPPLPPCVRTVPVTDSAGLAGAITAAQPGDCINLADGDYTFPMVTAKGTATAPIVISATNLLKATVSKGDLKVQSSAYVVVQGITWTSNGTIWLTDTDHGRISRFRIQRTENGPEMEPAVSDLAWVKVFGASQYCRVDHCDFGPQSAPGNMILITGTELTPVLATYTRVDHNYFHDVHFTGGNGWETIRSGADTLSYSSSYSLIEHNLFTNDANDPEIVSLKSSDNTLRYNTLRASAGQFNLRSGNRDIVYGNYILGDGVSGSLGLRVGGGGHKIYDNYVEGVGAPGIFLEGGDTTDPNPLPDPCPASVCDPRGQVNGTEVVFNTVVNAGGIVLGGGGHPLGPVGCTVAYNIVQGPGTLYSQTADSKNNMFLGNIGYMGTSAITTGVTMEDPMLTKTGDVYAIGAGSPAVNAGMATFAYVTDDIDGTPRDSMPDIGANEVSSAPAKYKLLTTADVGPTAP